jgi:hypothetical protein
MLRWLPIALALPLAGCGASGEDALVAQLVACDLVTAGEIGPRVLSGLYAPNACYQACLAGADCPALSAALCRTDVELLRRCDQDCAHRCADGALVGVERVCDGVPDCEDMGDEQRCPGWDVLVCRDRTRVTGRRCDGIYHCSDGSDEVGCSSGSCSGLTIPPYWRCNGYDECPDGSDELSCPTYRCADGRVVTYSPEGTYPRCDGLWNCSDSSDERGCAELLAMCEG